MGEIVQVKQTAKETEGDSLSTASLRSKGDGVKRVGHRSPDEVLGILKKLGNAPEKPSLLKKTEFPPSQAVHEDAPKANKFGREENPREVGGRKP